MLFEIIDELTTFINLVKLNSSQKLSEVSNITISTIWRHISIVEAYFSTKLIYRDSKKGIELTSKGLLIYNSLYVNHYKLQSHFQNNIQRKPTVNILTSAVLAQFFTNKYLPQIIASGVNFNFTVLTALAYKIYGELPHNNLLSNFAKGFDIIYIGHPSLTHKLNEESWTLVNCEERLSYLYSTQEYLNRSPYKLNSPFDLIHHTYIGEQSQNKLNLMSKNNSETIDLEIQPKLLSNSKHLRAVMLSENLGVSHLPEDLITLDNYKVSKNLIHVLPEYYTEISYISLYKNKNESEVSRNMIDDFVKSLI